MPRRLSELPVIPIPAGMEGRERADYFDRLAIMRRLAEQRDAARQEQTEIHRFASDLAAFIAGRTARDDLDDP